MVVIVKEDFAVLVTEDHSIVVMVAKDSVHLQ